MKKKFGLFLVLSLLTLSSCGEETEPPKTEEINGDLQRFFANLRNNNFSLHYEDSYLNNGGVVHTQDTYYTEYSLQSSGSFGFNGYAQDDDFIFSYTISDGEIVSGLPVVDSSTGRRYSSIYEYRLGVQDFDISYLEENVGADGTYTYTYGENRTNDRIITEVFFRMGYTEYFNPVSVKFKIENEILTIDATLTDYIFDNNQYVGSDTCNVRVYNVGNTQNTEILNYLNGGGSSKEPLDNRFFSLMLPYLNSTNYQIESDFRELINPSTMEYYTTHLNQHIMNNALLLENLATGQVAGVAEKEGLVVTIAMDSMDDSKLDITGTYLNYEGEMISTIHNEYLSYGLNTLSTGYFVGYKDDNDSDSYYLTDTYLTYVLSYLVGYESDTNENYVQSLKLTILNDNDHSFMLDFHFVNRALNFDKGHLYATFTNLNNVRVGAIDRLNNRGNEASSDFSELGSVLMKFSNHNYSFDIQTGSGLAKYYFTPDYFYCEVYGNPSYNYGYIKENDAIYEFYVNYNNTTPTSIDVDRSTNYAAGTSPMTLPGVGTYFGASNDLFYLSAFDEELLYSDNYVVDSDSIGFSYYRNTTSGLSQRALDYFYPGAEGIYPNGVGVIVSDSNSDTYDTRLTFIVSYITSDSITGYIGVTFYDIGGTHHEFIEQELL